MDFKYIFFDIDDTLCNYTHAHNIASSKIMNKYGYDINKNKHVINDTANISFKHNKLYYLQYDDSLFPLIKHEMYILYKNTFIDNLSLYDGVNTFLDYLHANNIKIGIITNLSLEIQLWKLHSLGILKYIDKIITSEEIQYEKPHKNIFEIAHAKSGLSKEQLCYIGNDYNTDICGSLASNIFSFHFINETELVLKNRYIIFGKYAQLTSFFNEIARMRNDLVNISLKYGSNIGLTQYNGGNVSIKYNNLLLIKSSGVEMGNITPNGITTLNNIELGEQVRMQNEHINVLHGLKPSIETAFHSILKKYVIHLHPPFLNRFLCDKNIHVLLKELNLSFTYSVIPYIKPGIDIATFILNNGCVHESIFFLLNHGLIVSADTLEKIDELMHVILYDFQQINIINGLLLHDFYKKLHTRLCVYQSYNSIIHANFTTEINFVCPDYAVYLTTTPYIINDIKELEEKPVVIPIIMKYGENIYIIHNSLSACKYMEDIYASYLLMIKDCDNYNTLSLEEITKIQTWSAEIYRKTIA